MEAPGMAFQFEVHETIDRPVEEVFEYVTNVENDEEWHPNVTETSEFDGEMSEGTTWTMSYDSPFGTTELHEECIVFEPPNRYGYETKNGLFGGRIRTTESVFNFTQDGDGTQVTISGETQVKGLLRVLQPLFKRMVTDELQSQLTELKSAMEQPTE